MLEAIYIGLSGALVAWMLNDWYKEGMIFSIWGKFIKKNEDKVWAQPLGACMFCHAIWITIAMAVIYISFPIGWQALTMLGVCHIFICIFVKNDL